MTDPMMQQITQRVADEIRTSAGDNDARAAELRDDATQLRAKAAELRTAADEHEQRAKDAEANAATWDLAAQVKRQEAARMLGRPELPTPGMISPVGELGMAVGALRMVPRVDASPVELESFRDLMQAIHAEALHQQQVAAARLRDAQATIRTGQLAPEDLPQPDALSAAPAEETDAHRAVELGRPVALESLAGPPPDFAGFRPEPDADADCEYCLTALIRVGGAWLHAETMAPECGPGSEHLTASPGDVRYRGAEDADVPEPEPAAALEPAADPKPDTARRGIHRVAKRGRTGRRARQAPSNASPYTSFSGTSDRMVAGRPETEPVWEPRSYPDAPANGAPVERERADGPSALALDGEITQAFPVPVIEDGDAS